MLYPSPCWRSRNRKCRALRAGPLHRVIAAPMNSVAGPGLLADAAMYTFRHNSRLAPSFFAKVAGLSIGHDGHFSDCQARACNEDRAAIDRARQLVTRCDRAFVRRALRCPAGARARPIIETNPGLRRPTSIPLGSTSTLVAAPIAAPLARPPAVPAAAEPEFPAAQEIA